MPRMWLVLALSLSLFAVQLVASHVTHSLALLAAAYHMLYNILSLAGCIATIKVPFCVHRFTKKRLTYQSRRSI